MNYANAFTYRGNRSTTANANSVRSGSVWYDIPFEEIRNGDIEGHALEIDFAKFKLSANVNASVAYWDQGLELYGSDGASLVTFDGVGGGVTFASDGDNEGVAFIQSVKPFLLARTVQPFAMEVLMQTSTITDTKHGWLIGLGDAMTLSATVPIAAAGTLADENFVGFHRLEGDGDAVDTVYKADTVTQVTVGADAFTIAAATDFKLAMRFDPLRDPYIQGPDSTAKWLVSFYKDGVRHATTKQLPSAAGTDFPNDVKMGVLFALLNATGTTPGTTTLKKLWAAQQY